MAVYKIPFGSEKHRKILDAIRRRWRFSAERLSTRYTEWSNMEEQFRAYIPEKENDALRRAERRGGNPQYTTVELPYSYAQLLSAHTYWASVFLSRTPILQFQGRHGESEDSVQAVEAAMNYQTSVGGMLVPWYIWLMDPGKYGYGVVGSYWDREEIVTSEIVEERDKFLGVPVGEPKKVRRTRRHIGYEGNRVYNVRPQDWFSDPRVAIRDFQRGEFCGAYSEVGWNTVLRREAQGKYYNIEQAKRSQPHSWFRDRGSEQLRRPNDDKDALLASGTEDSFDPLSKLTHVQLMEMHIELIPKDWELGTSTYPEKWVFTVVNDKVIVSAQPLGLLHDRFPFDVLEYEIEGYGLYKRSMLEMIKPLSDILTWLFNSHFYNVRKVLNNQFVVDPSRITMKDLTDSNGGRLIRLKPGAYGTDPRLAIHQLQISDVTQNHIRDGQVVERIIQYMTGVTDNLMGQVNTGGRKTATEVRTSSTAGINRLKTVAEYFSCMGWTPLAQKLVQNTQQLMEDEQKFRIAGDLTDNAQAFMQVDPTTIAGFYDFVPVDGTLPIDRFAQATLWKDLLAGIRNYPEVAQQYDLGKIFSYVAQLAGLKNINRFRINVRPDDEIDRERAAGNLVALTGGRADGGSGSAVGGGNSGGGNEESPITPRPSQIAGLGPST